MCQLRIIFWTINDKRVLLCILYYFRWKLVTILLIFRQLLVFVKNWVLIMNILALFTSLVCFNNRGNTCFFYDQSFFPTQPKRCLTILWIELQMLLTCCLIHIPIIILKHILYLVFLCSCLDLSLFMTYLCDLVFIFSIIFTIINHKISLKQIHFLWYLLLLLDDNMVEESV